MAGSPKLSLSPSNAGRWLICQESPAYLAREYKRIPDDKTIWNTEGDMAHAVAHAVTFGLPIPKESRGEKIPESKIPEMMKHAQGFKQFCFRNHPAEAMGEHKLSLFYMPDRNGYLDFISLDKDVIEVVDYKYGQGVAVSALLNDQMAIYARSFVEQEMLGHWLYAINDSTEVRMSIYQPRVRDGDIESTWTTTWGDLKTFTDNIGNIAADIIFAQKSGTSLKFAPSDKACQFCGAKTFCVARNKKPVEAMTPILPPQGAKSLPNPDSLTPEQIRAALAYRPEIKKWLDSVYASEMKRCATGSPPAGFKIVRGKGSSGWSDKSMVEELLLFSPLDEDTYAPRSLISPNQVELALKEVKASKQVIDSFKAMKEKFLGKPVLVREDDKRPAIHLNPASIMEAITDEDDLSETED